MTTSTTAEAAALSTAPTATTGNLAASPAASGDVDEVVGDIRIDGGIDIADGDDGGFSGITYRVG